jgi:hypothetical protein
MSSTLLDAISTRRDEAEIDMRNALARIWEIEARVSIGRAGSDELETAHARLKCALATYGSINIAYFAALGSDSDV